MTIFVFAGAQQVPSCFFPSTQQGFTMQMGQPQFHLQTLQYHRTPLRFKFLAIIQPSTPGTNPLPGTIEELKRLQVHVPASSIHILRGSDATTAKVLSGMDECSWVHLACHGVQDESDPLQSGLLLEDGRLQLSAIIQKHIPRGEFAFLAAGMLVAGYKGVIGTMWSIRDNDAPFVADKVYGRLLKNGQPSGVHL
ncbi:hypothetical protein BD410DRAFT_794547 [Rickenella mellea]|uniref:CHAT domain-containing protein n=1 Tax=Rickenella mellea TaxID=50990 RepID=A0A4Y7PQV2_9AGAM|nr:hypothetical protein BD410DRAFT_794547 [Rickenella mellea]